MTGRPVRTQSHGLGARKRTGFTLIELLAVLAIVGMLMGIASPRLQLLLDKARVAQAIGDIKALEADILGFQSVGDSLPVSLMTIGRGGMVDPWGRPYRYLRFDPTEKNPVGARMDRSLHPLNSDFDLFSMGKDGASATPITAKISQDDIIRANDGGFVGLARFY